MILADSLKATRKSRGNVAGRPTMTFTLFATICILGCDLLIYFLFQWTLGQRAQRKRRRGRKQLLSHGKRTELLLAPGSGHNRAETTQAVPCWRPPASARLVAGDGREARDPVSEEALYRRRVAALAVAR